MATHTSAEALDALVRLPSQERRHQRLTALLRNAEVSTPLLTILRLGYFCCCHLRLRSLLYPTLAPPCSSPRCPLFLLSTHPPTHPPPQNDARFTKDAVWRATRRPEPYAHPMKKTIDEVSSCCCCCFRDCLDGF